MKALDRLLPWILLVKALEVGVTAPILLASPLLGGLATAALVVGALVWLRSPRFGAGLTALVLLAFATGPLYRNHVAFLAWAAMLRALSRDETEQRLLLTVHLSVVYAFATLVKLNPDWLSGAALEGREVITLGVPEVFLAWATIVAEGLLAVLVWRPRRYLLPLVVGIHVAFVVGMSDHVLELLRLTVFNTAIVAVWLALLAASEDESAVPILAPARDTARAT